MIPGASQSDVHPAIDDRLVTFCNVFVAGLNTDVERLGGVDRFLAAFTRGLRISGLRVAAYKVETEAPGGSSTHGSR